MNRARVVVVDSGVDAHHPALRGIDVARGPTFAADGTASDGPAEADVLGHGTAVAATIVRFLPAGTPLELVSLRVFEREPTCGFGAVLAALRHAVALEPALVNVSLGTTSLRWREPLQVLVQHLRAAGARVTAPASYGGLACDPGNLPGVDAVVADANVLPMLPELRRDGERWVWFASPLPPVAADGVRTLRARGDSLAVAAVTGCLLRSLPR